MTSLAIDDVRALVRLLGELRELGRDPDAWRNHLLDALARICHAKVAVASEARVNPSPSGGEVHTDCATAVSPLHLVHRGIESDAFFRDCYWYAHRDDDPLEKLLPLYGTAFTVAREQLVDDRRWYASTLASERMRAHDCDDFLLSMAPVRHAGVICSLELFRSWKGDRFGERERAIVALLHEELARDWERASRRTERLTPRQREVLRQLVDGASEKEVAARLGVSPHTAHDHVKALYRAFGVRSRGELLGRIATSSTPRTHLAAES